MTVPPALVTTSINDKEPTQICFHSKRQ